MAQPDPVEEFSTAVPEAAATDNGPRTPLRDPDNWIRYCVEHRHRETDELIKRKDLGEPDLDSPPSTHSGPIFEVVTTYKITPSVHDRSGAAEQELLNTPTTAIRILSPAIINALRSVVDYYPDLDLSGEVIIQRPYCVLVHHYEEIKGYADARAAKTPDELCIREQGVVSHLTKLLEFLDDSVMSAVRAEMARNKDGFWTFEYAWVRMKPGKFLYHVVRMGKLFNAVIHSVKGGVLLQQAGDWNIHLWSQKYDGRRVGRKRRSFALTRWEGARPCKIRIFDYKDLVETKDENIARQILYGESYWQLLQKQCRYHKGEALRFPNNEV